MTAKVSRSITVAKVESRFAITALVPSGEMATFEGRLPVSAIASVSPVAALMISALRLKRLTVRTVSLASCAATLRHLSPSYAGPLRSTSMR